MTKDKNEKESQQAGTPLRASEPEITQNTIKKSAENPDKESR